MISEAAMECLIKFLCMLMKVAGKYSNFMKKVSEIVPSLLHNLYKCVKYRGNFTNMWSVLSVITFTTISHVLQPLDQLNVARSAVMYSIPTTLTSPLESHVTKFCSDLLYSPVEALAFIHSMFIATIR